jgi:hypothetical protein
MTKTGKGLWWLPERPDLRLFGEIAYGPTTGAQLNLLEYFFDREMQQDLTIWGEADGRPVSLFNCYTRSVRGFPARPGRNAEIEALSGVVGGHFAKLGEVPVAHITAEVSHLHEWTSKTGVSDFMQGTKAGLLVEVPPTIRLGSARDLTISIEFTEDIANKKRGDWQVHEKCLLSLSAPELTPYARFQEVLHSIQYFLAFAVGRPVYLLAITGRTSEPRFVVENRKFYDEFNILQSLSITDVDPPDLFAKMLFTLPSLSSEPAEFVDRFFAKRSQLQPTLDLYLSSLYNSEMPIRERFLTLSHAIEAYHRAFIGGKYQSDEDFEKGVKKNLLNAIPADILEDYRNSLRNKLNYLHEFSLLKRIKDICQRFQRALLPFIGDYVAFSRGVAAARNQLTHAEPHLANVDPTDMFWKTESLRLVLEVCLLHEIGFDDTKIHALLQRNLRAARLASAQR